MKLKLEGKTYIIPEGYDDLNIEDYKKIITINTDDLSKIDYEVKVISILTGIDEETIRNINLLQFDKLRSIVVFLYKTCENKETDKFNIDGVEYGLNKKLNNITWLEYWNLEELSNSKIYDNLDSIMAILYRPVIKNNMFGYDIEKFDTETIDDRAKIFSKKLTMDVVLPALVFFYHLKLKYISRTQGSLGKNKKEMKLIKRLLSPIQNLNGSTSYLTYQKEV